MTRCSFIPPYLLQHLVTAQDEQIAHCGEMSLRADSSLRSRREDRPPALRTTVAGSARYAIHSANNTEELPGATVRSEGGPPSGDAAVDEAYASTATVLNLFAEIFGRASVDGKGGQVSVTVHYGTSYVNAFWDGQQLVFGDGDGKVFDRFTKPMDVLAHEFTHGVTQFTAALTYQGQSGALNESVSDVFAAIAKQRSLGQSAQGADWLIGEGLFMPTINARALRSMKEPGTAYDDPKVGKDPQVGSMSEYVETADDNGGVHINSGIPNRAFQLAATAIGGNSWEGPGRIWYDTLTGGSIGPDTDFGQFATSNLESAGGLFGADSREADAVRGAWATVGIDAAASGAGPAETTSTSSSSIARTHVVVRRSGGFAGTMVTGEMDLASNPVGPEVAELLGRVDLRALGSAPPAPDRFVYTLEVDGERFDVPEQAMTPEVSRVINLVLGD